MGSTNFATAMVRWHRQCGRRNLPWQQQPTPYKVYLSETMLQQTQVATVIPYYHQFLKHFPTITDLAIADIDQVLTLWAGLGYYARGRNLHRSAQMITAKHQGQIPDQYDDLIALPGIGRSTAGAILSLGFHQTAAILDGNVKRVFCRYFGVEGWPDQSATNRQLWALAEELLPNENIHDYNQSLMDLGALVCARKTPQCQACPIQKKCFAYLHQMTDQLPTKRPKIKKENRQYFFLIEQNALGQYLFCQRPHHGIWGGLWTPPLIEEKTELPSQFQLLTHMKHELTHLSLSINFIQSEHACGIQGQWFDLDQLSTIGLPKPVKSFIEQLNQNQAKAQAELFGLD